MVGSLATPDFQGTNQSIKQKYVIFYCHLFILYRMRLLFQEIRFWDPNSMNKCNFLMLLIFIQFLKSYSWTLGSYMSKTPVYSVRHPLALPNIHYGTLVRLSETELPILKDMRWMFKCMYSIVHSYDVENHIQYTFCCCILEQILSVYHVVNLFRAWLQNHPYILAVMLPTFLLLPSLRYKGVVWDAPGSVAFQLRCHPLDSICSCQRSPEANSVASIRSKWMHS